MPVGAYICSGAPRADHSIDPSAQLCRVDRFLLVEERIEFVELFLQGMRMADLHAYLALRSSETWGRAAVFKQESQIQKRQSILDLSSPTGSKRSPSPPTIITKERESIGLDLLTTRQSSCSSDFDIVQAADLTKLLNSIRLFDDSDVQLPASIDHTIIKIVADARLQCWIKKKLLQRDTCNFKLSEQTTDILDYLTSIRHPDMLSGTVDEVADREEWAMWFLKLLVSQGYEVAYIVSDNGKGPGVRDLDLVEDADDLVDTVASTIHNKWLSKKYEAGWQYVNLYDTAHREMRA